MIRKRKLAGLQNPGEALNGRRDGHQEASGSLESERPLHNQSLPSLMEVAPYKGSSEYPTSITALHHSKAAREARSVSTLSVGTKMSSQSTIVRNQAPGLQAGVAGPDERHFWKRRASQTDRTAAATTAAEADDKRIANALNELKMQQQIQVTGRQY